MKKTCRKSGKARVTGGCVISNPCSSTLNSQADPLAPAEPGRGQLHKRPRIDMVGHPARSPRRGWCPSTAWGPNWGPFFLREYFSLPVWPTKRSSRPAAVTRGLTTTRSPRGGRCSVHRDDGPDMSREHNPLCQRRTQSARTGHRAARGTRAAGCPSLFEKSACGRSFSRDYA